jgi:hypothetical protein
LHIWKRATNSSSAISWRFVFHQKLFHSHGI